MHKIGLLHHFNRLIIVMNPMDKNVKIIQICQISQVELIGKEVRFMLMEILMKAKVIISIHYFYLKIMIINFLLM
jgi:hypothetical protein